MLDFSRLEHCKIFWVPWSQQRSYLFSRIFSKLTSYVAEKFLLHLQEICQQTHFIHGDQHKHFLNCFLYPPDWQREAYTSLLPLNCTLAAQNRPAGGVSVMVLCHQTASSQGASCGRRAAEGVWQCLLSLFCCNYLLLLCGVVIISL